MAIRNVRDRMKWRIYALAVLVAALAMHVPRRGEGQISSRADEAALRSYELTMPKFQAWVAASAAARQASRTLTENESRQLWLAPDPTIDQIAGLYDKVPALKKAVHGNGLSPREFTLFGLALMEALTIDATLRYKPNGSPPPNINPANLRFVAANRSVIEKGMSVLGAR